MAPPSPHEPTGSDLPDFIFPALRRLGEGCRWPAFAEWFVDLAIEDRLLFSDASDPAAEREDARRHLLASARQIWLRTPDPAEHWRLRTLLQPSRNDPCYCGSGRKYKHCCESIVAGLPPLDVDPATLAAGLVVEGPAALREPASLRRMPGAMLAAAAHLWAEQKGPAALVDLLEPVFLQPRGLDGRHEQAFDVLVDAMLDVDLDARRERVVREVAAQASDRHLRCSAHCRLAALLADRRDFEGAWQAFHAARREEADNLELLHLELTLLLAQERLAEAKARTPLLAARARKLGHPELAQALVDIEAAGPAALRGGWGADPEEQRAWIALLRTPLPHLDREGFTKLHAFTTQPAEGRAFLRIEPKPATRRSLAEWRRRFATDEAALTSLHGQADDLLDDAAEAAQWLAAHPRLCAAIPVLDDLLLAARAMEDEGAGRALTDAAADLAYAAADLLVQVSQDWPAACIEWAEHRNRPALRLVAQAIDRALANQDGERAVGWMRWMLERNPTDNHGWREELRLLLLRGSDVQGALAVLDAYPDDAPPAGHDRALALFMLGHRDDAESVLRAEQAKYPAFVQAVLPAALDRPSSAREGFLQFGGPDHAWEWRQKVRGVWESSGALAWLRGLDLPEAQARRPGSPPAGLRGKAAKRPASGGRQDTGAPDVLPVLRRHFGPRLAWALGYLAASAWSPELVMPTAWVQALADAADHVETDADAQALLRALMDQYNAFNAQRLAADAAARVPLPDAALDPAGDAAWAGFAAGFVQFAEAHARGAWRAAGMALDTRKDAFAPLYQLAAQAQPAPDGWRPVADGGGALLGLADNTVPARELLERALQPLWRATLARR